MLDYLVSEKIKIPNYLYGPKKNSLILFYSLKKYFDNFNKYECLFNYHIKNKYISLLAFGTKFEINVKIINNEIVYELILDENIILQKSYPLPNTIAEYYIRVFNYFDSFTRQINQKIKKEFQLDLQDFPFLGGFKCVTDLNSDSTVMSYTIPLIWGEYDGCYLSLNSFLEIDFNRLKTSISNPTNSLKFYASKNIFTKKKLDPTCLDYIDSLLPVVNRLGNECKKVVLSRKVKLESDEKIEPLKILYNTVESISYDIYFKNEVEHSWVSVTPETLVKINSNKVVVEPLAGTRNSSENLTKELLSDKKENLEHSSSVEYFLKMLQKKCKKETIKLEESKQIINLGYVQHLKSKISGELQENYSVLNLLEDIYPPATIWGLPIIESGKIIRENESFFREFFCGSFGYFKLKGEANLALTIRCAKISDYQMDIFAGSGLVEGSDPYKEWLETSNKMKPFFK